MAYVFGLALFRNVAYGYTVNTSLQIDLRSAAESRGAPPDASQVMLSRSRFVPDRDYSTRPSSVCDETIMYAPKPCWSVQTSAPLRLAD